MERPDPLVPEEVDLTDFKFMPLEVARLLQSEWWIMACAEDPRRAVAAINLWARAWHQRPSASLPDNDVVLSKMADVTYAVWREIRDAVMAPWVLCSDGRWYHPVVAEKANEAWVERLGYQQRKAEFSARQKARGAAKWESSPNDDNRRNRSERLAEARQKGNHTKEQWAALVGYCGGKCVKCGASENIVKDHIIPIYQGGSDGIENLQPLCASCNSSKGPDRRDFRPAGWRDMLGVPAETPAATPAGMPAGLPAGTPAECLPMKGRGTGKGKGKGIKEKDKSFSAGADATGDPDFSDLPVTRPPSEGYTAEFEAWWAIYPRKDSKGTAFKAFKAAKGRAPVDKLMDGAAAYAKRRVGEDPQYTKQPATWLNADAWNDEQPRPRRNLGYTPMGVGG